MGEMVFAQAFPGGRADFYIDSNYAAIADGFKEPRIKQQRSAIEYAGFDNEVGLNGIHNFLHANQVFGKLQDRQAKPGKRVVITERPANANPFPADEFEGFFSEKRDIAA